MAVAAAEGLEALTIRRLAQELSVTPMALYWHFADKEALLGGISDRLWDETVTELDAGTPVAGDGWGELRRTVDALVTVLRRHPAVAVLAQDRVMECPSGLHVTETTLGLLSALGFDLPAASETAYILLVEAVALVSNNPAADDDDSPEGREALRRKRLALASLDPERYPLVGRCAEFLTSCVPDTFFGRGVDMVVGGIREVAPKA